MQAVPTGARVCSEAEGVLEGVDGDGDMHV